MRRQKNISTWAVLLGFLPWLWIFPSFKKELFCHNFLWEKINSQFPFHWFHTHKWLLKWGGVGLSTRFARSLTFGVKERTRAGYNVVMHLVPNVIFVFHFFCKSLFKTGQLKYEICLPVINFPEFFWWGGKLMTEFFYGVQFTVLPKYIV